MQKRGAPLSCACLPLAPAAAPADLELDRTAKSNTTFLQRAAHWFAAVVEREKVERDASLRRDDLRESRCCHCRRSVDHDRAPRPRHLKLQRLCNNRLV